MSKLPFEGIDKIDPVPTPRPEPTQDPVYIGDGASGFGWGLFIGLLIVSIVILSISLCSMMTYIILKLLGL